MRVSGVCCFSLFVLLVWIATAGARETKTSQGYSTNELVEKLSRDPAWLQLLHYDPVRRKSTVLNDTFFLAPGGRGDARAELGATLKAYYEPWGTDSGAHPRCRFPARYYWLNSKLHLPGFTARPSECERLLRWEPYAETESVSLLLVSGYLGNPASTFGHALMKFNSSDRRLEENLFDTALNYGARVPENENTLVYVLKGLFGGYEAGFSDRYYYTQDLVYNRTEFRDVWEYRLDLDPAQKDLLLLHIWELSGMEFRYYFLKENCAYKLAELLDVVVPEADLKSARVWYAPVELFLRLSMFDRRRRAAGLEPFVRDVRFIPSEQKRLYAQLSILNRKQLAAMQTVIDADYIMEKDRLAGFSVEEEIEIVDGLLAYKQYLLVAAGEEAEAENRAEKNLLLAKRFSLLPRAVQAAPVDTLRSPAAGSPPRTLVVGVATGSQIGSYSYLAWAPYKNESVGNNGRWGDELIVLNLRGGYSASRKRFFLDRLDFIRVSNLNTYSIDVAGQSPRSWQLRLGAERLQDTLSSMDVFASFGVGMASRFGRHVIGYLMLDLAFHDEVPRGRILPKVGCLTRFGNFKIEGTGGFESEDYEGHYRPVWTVAAQYNLGPRFSLNISSERREEAVHYFGVSYYW